ncbi:MAG: sigma-70 family RNA polymerase sigma factor [Oligoflexia bacterium]|nr:sigma-70 family RNA polymerase sigma factor [Oligoflexia bacterium]
MSDEKLSKETDTKLMLLYQGGDEKALEELYRRYSGRVYAYLKKRLFNKDWADDIFQQIFAKLHQTRHQYNPNYRFDQWIFVMTKTVLLDFWKTTEVKNKRYFSESIDNVVNSESLITQPMVDKHAVIYEPSMAVLSSDQRAAIELKFIDELSYHEIANKLGRTEESVRQLISRAIRKIRKQIKVLGGKT